MANLGINITGNAASLRKELRAASADIKRFSADAESSSVKGASRIRREYGGALDSIAIKSKRASAVGIFRFGASGALGLGAGLVVGAQAVRELGDALEVTGAQAATTEGRFRNAGAALLSGNVIGAFKSLRAEYTLTEEQAAQVAVSVRDAGQEADVSAGKAAAAALGWDSLAGSMLRVQEALRAISVQKALENATEGLSPPGEQTGPGFKGQDAAPGGIKNLPNLFSGVSKASQEALLDAQIASKGGTSKAIIDALKRQEQELRAKLKSGNLTPNERFDVKAALEGVTGSLDAIFADLARQQQADAAAKAQAAQDRLDRIVDGLFLKVEQAGLTDTKVDDLAALRAVKAELIRQLALTKDDLKLQQQLVSVQGQINAAKEEQIANAKQQADDIKNAVLDSFDLKVDKRQNQRDLEDAQKELRRALQIGGPEGIKEARRNLEDAQSAIQRQQLEQSTFSLKDRPGNVDQLTITNNGQSIVVNINGADDPEKIAKQVIAIIRKTGKRGAPSSRGRTPGQHQGGV